MKKALVFSSLVAVLSPLAVFAQAPNTTYISNFLSQFGTIVTSLPPILIGLAVVLFLWGLVKFLFAADDDDAKKSAKSLMIWGLVAILVMVSIWGIIALLQNFLGISPSSKPNINPLQ